MPNLDELMKMAQEAQAKLMQAQEDLDKVEVQGVSGGGMVRGLRTDCLAAAGAVSLYGGGPWSAGSDDGADRGVEPSTPPRRSLGERSDKSRIGRRVFGVTVRRGERCRGG